MSLQTSRLLRALAREGLEVTHADGVYQVRLLGRGALPFAQVLLPSSLPLESRALLQLAHLAAHAHPLGGSVTQVCATPDVHPGDGGVAIGSVVRTEELVIPSAVGTDINCGMRLHVADVSLEQFLSVKERFVHRLKGDFFFGTRDLPLPSKAMRAMLAHGLPGLWLELESCPGGRLAHADFRQLFAEVDRVSHGGSLAGEPRHAPDGLLRQGVVRDPGLGTIGGGNHFVEVQVVEELVDRALAWRWGLREGQLAFMVHSGSRDVGKHIGFTLAQRARRAWPSGVPHPPGELFSIARAATPELFAASLTAEATAANYGFANRALLAELVRLALRDCLGDVEAPLVADLPHNLTFQEQGGLVARKGACPAHSGAPVLIPGSMGDASWVLEGLGSREFLASASHGAGRLRSRFELSRAGAQHDDASLGLEGVECVALRPERRIEEAPRAYKPIAPVIDAQVERGLVRRVARLSPVLTFKG